MIPIQSLNEHSWAPYATSLVRFGYPTLQRFWMLIFFLVPLWTMSARAADPPNIILLMGDDHGWDETSYNGHPYLKTPVLDEMVASGLRLDNFYSAHPSCSPTRGSVITGRHPNRYGTFAPNYSIRPEEVSLAQLLAQRGYRCGHFGKWHLGPVKASSLTNPGSMGFHEWLSHDNFFELDPQLSRNGGPPQKFSGESSQVLIHAATEFIGKTIAQRKPFLAVIWFGSPHEPYSGLDTDLKRYANVRTEFPGQTVKLTSMQTGRPTTRPLGEVLQERYAEISAMDRAIGNLRTWLADHQQRQNTLVWYCGDNGTPSGGIVTSPFRGQKGTTYEGGIRVPGIVEWPDGIPHARSSGINCVTSDILPTICELTEQRLPNRPLDGVSLVRLFDGSMTQRSRPIFFWSFQTKSPHASRTPYIAPNLQEGTTPLVKMMAGRYTRNFTNFQYPKIRKEDYGGSRVMLSERFKLVVHQNTPELYDLVQDSSETNDLANLDSKRTKAMLAELREWQTSVLGSLTGKDYE